MRLIDADALKDIEYINKGNFNSVEGIWKWIDNAPTVARTDYEAKLDFWKERQMKIYERRKSGETLEAIASDYGVTRERIRQLYLKAERQIKNADQEV